MAQALTNRVNVKNVSMKYSSADHSERWAWRHRMDSTMLLYPPTHKRGIFIEVILYFFLFLFPSMFYLEKGEICISTRTSAFFSFKKEKVIQKWNVFFSRVKYIYIYIYWILDAMLNYLSARNSLHGRDTKRSCSVSESVKWLKLFP